MTPCACLRTSRSSLIVRGESAVISKGQQRLAHNKTCGQSLLPHPTSTMSFQASSAKLHYEPGSWQEMLNDVYTGTVVGAAHSIYLVAKWWYVNLFRPILHLFGFYLPEDKVVKSQDGEKTLKVVAVGYGRTGTVSLFASLPHGPPLQISKKRRPGVTSHFLTHSMLDVS